MPTLAHTGGDYPISNFGFKGSDSQGNDDGFAFARDPTGLWGIGVRLRDMSFIENLKHTFLVNLMGGTNSPTMAKYMLGKKNPGTNYYASANTKQGDFVKGAYDDFNSFDTIYLTTQDYAVEVNLNSSYKIYENLEMQFELGYIHLMLDQSRSVWGPGTSAVATGANKTIRGMSTTDAFKAQVLFVYSF
jgi:hypothetical protein